MFSNNLTMMTDLYELTMMQGYFFEGNNDTVVFDVFYRKNPSGSAYAIACGFDEVELPEASAARQPVEQWVNALGQISHGYQRGYGDSGNILDRRRSARLKHAAAG